MKIWSTRYKPIYVEFDLKHMTKELTGIFALDSEAMFGDVMRLELRLTEDKYERHCIANGLAPELFEVLP